MLANVGKTSWAASMVMVSSSYSTFRRVGVLTGYFILPLRTPANCSTNDYLLEGQTWWGRWVWRTPLSQCRQVCIRPYGHN